MAASVGSVGLTNVALNLLKLFKRGEYSNGEDQRRMAGTTLHLGKGVEMTHGECGHGLDLPNLCLKVLFHVEWRPGKTFTG